MLEKLVNFLLKLNFLPIAVNLNRVYNNFTQEYYSVGDSCVVSYLEPIILKFESF